MKPKSGIRFEIRWCAHVYLHQYTSGGTGDLSDGVAYKTRDAAIIATDILCAKNPNASMALPQAVLCVIYPRAMVLGAVLNMEPTEELIQVVTLGVMLRDP